MYQIVVTIANMADTSIMNTFVVGPYRFNHISDADEKVAGLKATYQNLGFDVTAVVVVE